MAEEISTSSIHGRSFFPPRDSAYDTLRSPRAICHNGLLQGGNATRLKNVQLNKPLPEIPSSSTTHTRVLSTNRSVIYTGNAKVVKTPNKKLGVFKHVLKSRLRNISALKSSGPKKAIQQRHTLNCVQQLQRSPNGHTPAPPQTRMPTRQENPIRPLPSLDYHYNLVTDDLLSPEKNRQQDQAWESKHELRMQSDYLLAMVGRNHLSDPLIGRAPPLFGNPIHGRFQKMTVAQPLQGQACLFLNKHCDKEDVKNEVLSTQEFDFQLSTAGMIYSSGSAGVQCPIMDGDSAALYSQGGNGLGRVSTTLVSLDRTNNKDSESYEDGGESQSSMCFTGYEGNTVPNDLRIPWFDTRHSALSRDANTNEINKVSNGIKSDTYLRGEGSKASNADNLEGDTYIEEAAVQPTLAGKNKDMRPIHAEGHSPAFGPPMAWSKASFERLRGQVDPLELRGNFEGCFEKQNLAADARWLKEDTFFHNKNNATKEEKFGRSPMALYLGSQVPPLAHYTPVCVPPLLPSMSITERIERLDEDEDEDEERSSRLLRATPLRSDAPLIGYNVPLRNYNQEFVPPLLPNMSITEPIERLDHNDSDEDETLALNGRTTHGPILQTRQASGPIFSLTPRPPGPIPQILISRSDKTPASPNLRTPRFAAVSSFSRRLFGRELSRTRTPQVPSETDTKMENRLAVRTEAKTKAVDDARKMQAYVVEECKKSGKDPPPYGLEELIGKGSFGRVYKGKDMTTAKVVAIKIIDIDESDTLNPKNSDAYSEFLKEVNALKLLGESKAKNINLVMEALPVGKAMWMITEYCGGGSVATLMKPTLPKGLSEKWVRIIVREVAEGLYWVHQVGIIHRDIKCANVLVTENGDVQLCDFGVAGIVENKTDKRSTIVGTPHWMAPELLEDTQRQYGKEVDIWAFGAMVYEMASGLPPLATDNVAFENMHTLLKKNAPRLPAGIYSEDLRDIIACCLQPNPEARPAIETLQKHRYIYKTATNYPTSELRDLVLAFRKWETDGGTRKSLFWQHGAQAPSAIISPTDDDWIFSVTDDFEARLQSDSREGTNAYQFSNDDGGRTARATPQQGKPSRRRPPPEALGRGLSNGPLEKLFDPNTLTSYSENIAARYGKQSDLPLRDDSADTSIRDTMIDLGGHDAETGISNFSDMDTIRANRRGDEGSDVVSNLHDFSRPALSDPADINLNRRTQDWKFPSAAPPASADPEVSRFPQSSYEIPRPSVTPGSGDRPPLIHHPTEPLGAFGGGLTGANPVPALERLSIAESLIDLDLSQRLSMRESLIDLDMSLPDPIPEYRRPSTANSDVGSTTSEQMTSANPFELERHPSLYRPIQNGREPSIYVSDDSALPLPLQNGNIMNELGEVSDYSGVSDAEGYTNDQYPPTQYSNGNNGYYEDRQPRGRAQQYEVQEEDDRMPPPPRPLQPHPLRTSSRIAMPPVPEPPSSRIFAGMASQMEVQTDVSGMIQGLAAQLNAFREAFSSPEVMQRVSSGAKRERRDPPPPAV